MSDSENQNTLSHVRLYLMRHGQVERSAADVCYGHYDVPLSAQGKDESHRLCKTLESENIGAVYSSDLSRAVYAADLLARSHSADRIILPQLREINMGEWECRSLKELSQSNPRDIAALLTDPEHFCYPGGESFGEFQRRVQSGLEVILARRSPGAAAAVTHGGVCRMILGSVLDLKAKDWLRLAQDHGCLNVIDWFDGSPIISRMNLLPGSSRL